MDWKGDLEMSPSDHNGSLHPAKNALQHTHTALIELERIETREHPDIDIKTVNM